MAIPSPAVAARRIAALFVSRLNLEPPIDVELLLRERAELHRVDWPVEGVDAVLTGLGHGGGPRIYYCATSNLARERFTLAHELGHLVLPWHLPRADCETGSGDLDLPRYTPEEEADVFASCVLLPDSWLLALLKENAHDMSMVLRRLNEAEVTTVAALRALRRVLLAGWAFVAYGDSLVTTPGTSVAGQYTESIGSIERRLREDSHANGEAQLNGFPVRWYRMSEPTDPPVLQHSDSRTDHEVLVAALSVVELDSSRIQRLVQVCNGKVGGALREAAGRPSSETYQSLLYRFRESEYAHLLDIPDLHIWLARKARAVEMGSTRGQGSGRTRR